MSDRLTILCGDVLEKLVELPDESVNCCVTSPPYWQLRNYGVPGQIGLEKTPQEFVAKMVQVFREVRRVLRKDGVCWVNLGDSYAVCGGKKRDASESQKNAVRAAKNGYDVGGWSGKTEHIQRCTNTAVNGLKPKDLCGIPWRVAFALQEDGWWLRQDVIWHKPNPMPESVRDRCTKAHEYIFMLTKSARYWWDAEAIWEAATSDLPIVDKSNRTRGRAVMFGIDNGPDQYGSIGYSGDGKNRNRRSVWTITTQPYPEAHFATFPEELPKLCILASCPPDGTVLDPFAGSGTTGKVAIELGRKAVLIELNPTYAKLIEDRCFVTPGFAL